ncbi:ADP-ribose pyrophosphatase [Gammaproteobacteria bacterium]
MDQPVELIDCETCYAGFFHLNRYRLRHRLFAGGMSPVIVRERLERMEAAAVLLYDPDHETLVLIEQFRIGVLEEGSRAWLWEIVGGLIETGETPESVARRESLEEAGCELAALEKIGVFHVSPGTASERLHLYCGRVDSRRAGGIHGLPDEGEDIRVVVLPWQEAMGELFHRINSTSALVAIQWLALNREALHAKWPLSRLDPID